MPDEEGRGGADAGATAGGLSVLILGIGNILMGDEGIGVYVVRHLEEQPLPAGVECLDGGTGSLQLLEPMQGADRVVLVDATLDDNPPGSVRRLRPRFSKDYPPTLTAHDIGLKDLLDALFLLGNPPEVTLFAISIVAPGELHVGLSDELAALLPEIADRVRAEVGPGPPATG